MKAGLDATNDCLIGILSDAHGNGPAFDRAIALLTELGAESFRYLGDAVGYIPSLSVITSLRELGSRVRCIKGNHEQALLSDHLDADRDTVYQLSVVKAAISPNDLAMIAVWGLARTERFAAQSALFVHGSPANPTTGYVYPDTDLSVFKPEVEIVFMGHSHYPFVRECGGIHYVNVGSCGLPRDDGRFGSAALYDPASGRVRVVRFDITAETNNALAASPPVHPAVRELMLRRNPSIFGDLV